jgi:hypothetical protein
MSSTFRAKCKIFQKKPGEGSLYAAQIVCVGFHSFPGEGAASGKISKKSDLCHLPKKQSFRRY